jgi:glycosyltransferase involved in cell wall biosynthesis
LGNYYLAKNEMKTILVITDNTQDQINGVATTFKNLERLASSDNFNIVYLNPHSFYSISAPRYPEVKLSFPKGIGEKIRAANPSYIHIATEGPIGLAAKLWLDKRNWKYNTSYHTKFPEFVKKIYGVPECFTYAYLRWFHKHSGVVLTTTQTMVNELKQHGFDGNILPWTRGVDRDIFHPRDKTTSRILLNVGRVSKEKGLDDFCKINYNNARKIVVGDGPYRKELEEKYPDVEFVGVKRGVELAEYYCNSDVFVFPSREDTFGIVMIEAMACGVPVAAYPVTGPRDVIEQNETGFMSESLSVAIQHCLNLDRSNVYEKSKKWTWENCWYIFKTNLVEV